MSEAPSVSVVTPVYNGGRFLDECIRSVRQQSRGDFEYVILDNASTDDTADIIARHAAADARIRAHRNERTLPVIENWNRSMRLISAQTRYCRVLHADDTMPPDALDRSIAVAERHPSVGIVGSLRQRGPKTECGGLPTDRELFPGREIGRLFLREEVFALAPTSNLLRADLVRAREDFYPTEYLHADLAVYFELLQECDVGFVHDTLAFSREHEDSITVKVAKRKETLLREWLLMLQRYGPAFMPADELAEVERTFLRRYYRNLVRGLVTLRGREFLRYHLAGLRQAGRSPSALDLAGAVGRETWTALTRPDKLRRHLRA